MPVENPKQTMSNEQDKKVVSNIKSVAKTGLSWAELNFTQTEKKVAEFQQTKNVSSLAPELDKNQITKGPKTKNYSSWTWDPDKVAWAMS